MLPHPARLHPGPSWCRQGGWKCAVKPSMHLSTAMRSRLLPGQTRVHASRVEVAAPKARRAPTQSSSTASPVVFMVLDMLGQAQDLRQISGLINPFRTAFSQAGHRVAISKLWFSLADRTAQVTKGRELSDTELEHLQRVYELLCKQLPALIDTSTSPGDIARALRLCMTGLHPKLEREAFSEATRKCLKYKVVNKALLSQLTAAGGGAAGREEEHPWIELLSAWEEASKSQLFKPGPVPRAVTRALEQHTDLPHVKAALNLIASIQYAEQGPHFDDGFLDLSDVQWEEVSSSLSKAAGTATGRSSTPDASNSSRDTQHHSRSSSPAAQHSSNNRSSPDAQHSSDSSSGRRTEGSPKQWLITEADLDVDQHDTIDGLIEHMHKWLNSRCEISLKRQEQHMANVLARAVKLRTGFDLSNEVLQDMDTLTALAFKPGFEDEVIAVDDSYSSSEDDSDVDNDLGSNSTRVVDSDSDGDTAAEATLSNSSIDEGDDDEDEEEDAEVSAAQQELNKATRQLLNRAGHALARIEWPRGAISTVTIIWSVGILSGDGVDKAWDVWMAKLHKALRQPLDTDSPVVGALIRELLDAQLLPALLLGMRSNNMFRRLTADALCPVIESHMRSWPSSHARVALLSLLQYLAVPDNHREAEQLMAAFSDVMISARQPRPDDPTYESTPDLANWLLTHVGTDPELTPLLLTCLKRVARIVNLESAIKITHYMVAHFSQQEDMSDELTHLVAAAHRDMVTALAERAQFALTPGQQSSTLSIYDIVSLADLNALIRVPVTENGTTVLKSAVELTPPGQLTAIRPTNAANSGLLLNKPGLRPTTASAAAAAAGGPTAPTVPVVHQQLMTDICRAVRTRLHELDWPLALFSLAQALLITQDWHRDRDTLSLVVDLAGRKANDLDEDTLVECIAVQVRPRVPLRGQAQLLFNTSMRAVRTRLHDMSVPALLQLLRSMSDLCRDDRVQLLGGMVDYTCDTLVTKLGPEGFSYIEQLEAAASALNTMEHYHEGLLRHIIDGMNKERVSSCGTATLLRVLRCLTVLAPEMQGVRTVFTAAAHVIAPRLHLVNNRTISLLAYVFAVSNQHIKIRVDPRWLSKRQTYWEMQEAPSHYRTALMADLLVHELWMRRHTIRKESNNLRRSIYALRIWAVMAPVPKAYASLLPILAKVKGDQLTCSDSQLDIARLLRRSSLGLANIRTESHVKHKWFVDVSATHIASGKTIHFEIDGPMHFTTNEPYRVLGSTRIRNLCLQKLGCNLVTLALHETPMGDEEMTRFIKKNIQAVVNTKEKTR